MRTMAFAASLLLVVAAAAEGQSVPNCPAMASPQPTIVAKKGPVSGTTWTQLNETVTVVIDGVCAWTQQNKVDPNDLKLYIAGHLLEKSAPTAVNLPQDYLKFDLKMDSVNNRDQWVKVLTAARESRDHKINISVGHPASKAVFVSELFITFNVYPWYSWLIVVGLLVLLVVLVLLGWRTYLLRNVGVTAAGVTPPFSLGLVQMAWWFYLVVACYLYIWLITGEYNTLTEGVLALTGISAATGLGAVFVEGQKRQTLQQQRAELSSLQTALQARIAEITAAAPTAGSPLDAELQDKKTQLAKANADLAALPALPPAAATKGFVADVLSDADGVKFHRFQIAVWTVVLGIVFGRLAYADFAMPEFSPLLLGLMGISSGTYLSFKFPEAPK